MPADTYDFRWIPQNLKLIKKPLRLMLGAVFSEAIALFQQQQQPSCLLVFQAEKLVGIVTRRDIVNHVLVCQNVGQLAIAEVMSAPVITHTVDGMINGLALQKLFEEEKISHLPLLDVDQNFIGLLTEKNLLAYLSSLPQNTSQLNDQQSDIEHDAQLYHLLVNSSPMGIFQTDANGFCTFVNSRWSDITGLPGDRALGDGWSQALHPDDREKVAAEWYAAAAENRPFDLEYRFQKADGSETWVHGRSVAAETDQNNNVVGYVGSITDIQQRKTFETVLAHILDGTATVTGHDFFNALVHHLGEATGMAYVFVTELENQDRLKNLAYWEQGSIKAMAPYPLADTPCEFVLRDRFFQCLTAVASAFPEDDDLITMAAESYIGIALQDAEGQPLGHICVMDTKPLEPSTAQMIRHVLEVFAARAGAELLRKRTDEALQAFTATLEKKVAERTEQLAASQKQLQLITDSIPGAIAYFDASERYQFVNQTYCQWFQQPLKTIIGHTILEAFGQDKYDQCLPHIKQVLAGKTANWETEINYEDRETRHITATFVPDFGEENQVKGCYLLITDISDRHRIEQELQTSKAELQTLFEAMDDAVFLINFDTAQLKIISKNSDNLYRPSTEIIEQRIDEIFPQELSQYFIDCLQRTMAAGSSQQFEYSLPINGTEKRFSATCSILPDRHLLWVARDITDYHNAKITLQTSEAEFKSLFAAMDDIVLVFDAQGNYRKVISTKVEQLIRPQTDLLGHNLTEFFPPEKVKFFIDCIQTTLRLGKTQTCEYAIDIRGQETWFSASCSVLNDNQVLWIARNVSDRKYAELQFQEASYRLSLATRGAKIGLWDYDVTKDRLIWDAQQYKFYGVSPADFKGRVKDWTDRVHPEDLPRMCRLFTRAFQGKNINELESEFRIILPDGETRYLKGNAIVLRDEEGSATRVLGVNFDITAYKTTEAELLQAKQVAESAAQTKSLFLANMSHEIRTPMNGVVGMLELLHDSPLTEQQRSHLAIAQSSAESLLSLINDILDFSKVEAGKLDLEHIDFELHHLIKNIVKTTALKAQEKGLELIVDLRRLDNSVINGDPSRIQQIFTNLLSNAVKFTERGNIILTSHLVEDTRGLWLVGSVTDQGIGITADKLQALFHPFTQLDASTTRKYGGTGLGLTITKKICELMDGDITARSEPKQGSCFEFRVKVQQSKGSGQSQTPKGLPLEVLLVEGNPVLCEILSSQLEAWDIKVTAVASSVEAIAAVTERSNTTPFNVALINHTIADCDREQFCRTLKDMVQPTNPNFAIIVMTAIANLTADQAISSSAADTYLTKPILPLELAQTLSNLDKLTTAKNTTPTPLEPNQTVNPPPTTPPKWPEHTKLLVVEDNRVNQLVIQSSLKKMGLTSDIATQGYEALRQLRESPLDQPYRLILMDCLMPEMNGYETTERIRNGETGEHYRNIPIVALTANAMKGDREKCLAAGMNDYLSKPIKAKTLRAVLYQWLAPQD
ncbi:PAS domain-containing protein [[Limnothrix rosea] IAM M-220]|uniref:PAS domain-containing protein n=1 Tax=[Limnothrix rosea] IAM M-220 TaxID=454133 RepID=UPI000964307D|nr:PAS domain-containing protein [[Limnothrix rosea] IAM M-220]OKH19222.1 hypothetical protein NIES208_02935 [[Limnothrix rosea] IAM M-220]